MNQNYGYMAMSLIQKHIPFTVPYVIIACISNIHLNMSVKTSIQQETYVLMSLYATY